MSIGWAVLFAAADKFGENAVSDAVGFGINTGGLQCQFFQTGADDFVFGGGKTLIEQGTGFHFGADFVDGTGAAVALLPTWVRLSSLAQEERRIMVAKTSLSFIFLCPFNYQYKKDHAG